VLDTTVLSSVAGLDSNIRFPGFANWSCTWGDSSAGGPQVYLLFRIDAATPR